MTMRREEKGRGRDVGVENEHEEDREEDGGEVAGGEGVRWETGRGE